MARLRRSRARSIVLLVVALLVTATAVLSWPHVAALLRGAALLLSAGFPDELQQARSDESLLQHIDGLTVFQGNVDSALVTWAHQRDLLMLAWTVNDFPRVNELVAMGVDGITTANLAVLRTLS